MRHMLYQNVTLDTLPVMPYKPYMPNHDTTYCRYDTRHMPVDLLDRARILAATLHESLETIVAKAIAIGITALEQE